ncbi:MAG: ferritin family protein [Hyphomicrobiaceae bacterium]|nr:ferritin family protein [Hyphomicrobiaceae bacterium]
MGSVEEFLAYAIKLEEEAVLRFGELADAMNNVGNREVGTLFRRLSDYSKLHMADAKARAGFRDMPVMMPAEFQWPDFESPETAAIWAADPMMGKRQALDVALESEKRGLDFYQACYDHNDDPEIRILAKEFVEEEGEHVAELLKWIANFDKKASQES